MCIIFRGVRACLSLFLLPFWVNQGTGRAPAYLLISKGRKLHVYSSTFQYSPLPAADAGGGGVGDSMPSPM